MLDTLTQKMLTSSDHGDGPSEVDERMLELDYDDSQADDGVADGDDPPDANASAARQRARRIPMNAIILIDMRQICPIAASKLMRAGSG